MLILSESVRSLLYAVPVIIIYDLCEIPDHHIFICMSRMINVHFFNPFTGHYGNSS